MKRHKTDSHVQSTCIRAYSVKGMTINVCSLKSQDSELFDQDFVTLLRLAYRWLVVIDENCFSCRYRLKRDLFSVIRMVFQSIQNIYILNFLNLKLESSF